MTNPSRITLTDPLFLHEPLDVDDARQALRTIAAQRSLARAFLEERITIAADAKTAYRRALAEAFVRPEGDTAAAKEANARKAAAGAEYARDVAEGMVKVAQEKLEEIDGKRASLHKLIEWSMKVDPHASEDRAPANTSVIGARA